MGFSGESLKAEKGMYQARLGRHRCGKIEGKRSAWPHVSRCWLLSTRLSESWASSPQHVLYSYCFFKLSSVCVCVCLRSCAQPPYCLALGTRNGNILHLQGQERRSCTGHGVNQINLLQVSQIICCSSNTICYR